jgi:diguanylate cyclase (GGDEF)-like protein/PAS domain S-box-containing protein
MVFGRLRGLFSKESRGVHFVAVVAMGPLAAVAIMAMRAVHLAARTPIWLIPLVLVCGQAITTITAMWWTRSPNRARLHVKVASQALVVTAAVYSTGWGPALAIGFILIGQETLATTGVVAQRTVLGWGLAGLIVGQGFIALGWAPSLIPVPEVHGLAVLMAVGIVFSYRSLISALVENEEAAALTEQRERRFRALVQSSHDLVFVADTASCVTYASPSCAQVLGYDPAVLLGSERAEYMHTDDLDGLRAAMRRTMTKPGGHAELLFRIRHVDGSWHWVEGVATNLVDDEAVGGFVINVRDVTERVSAEEAIRHQALHDPLTALPNRALFNDRLEQAVARQQRVGGHLAVLIVDLDGFKTVNDSLGHQVGDELLVAVAERFAGIMRNYETIARLGGDEFAILLEDLQTPEHAGRVAERVIDVLSAPIELTDREVAIGASIGIAIAEHTDRATERLLSHADAAMYRAKHEGKGCYRVFESSMHAAAMQRLELEQALRVAIANNALTVHYQPIIELHTGRVSGFEALARWDHEARGPISPNTFIPIAEDTNLILDLGRQVLTEACSHATRWRRRYPALDLKLAVNISRIQLAHPTFVSDTTHALRCADLPARALIVEVTESILSDDSGRVINTLDALRRSGIRVAIDDFGTGYSSFATLADLPIDILKIDKRFIDNIARNHQGRGFVNAIIQLAQTLGLETIAEGVERREQQLALCELGSTHLQGYIHSRPLTTRQADKYLDENQRADRLGLPHSRV